MSGSDLLKEFRTFAMRGNVIDLAVGVVVGGAFGKIVTSLVNDIVMPPIGLLLGRVDFSNLFISLSSRHFDSVAEAKQAGVPTINYGIFLNTILEFLIIAFSIFLVVRQINRLHAKLAPPPAAAPPATKDCPYCCTAIPVAATRCPNCTSTLSGALAE